MLDITNILILYTTNNYNTFQNLLYKKPFYSLYRGHLITPSNFTIIMAFYYNNGEIIIAFTMCLAICWRTKKTFQAYGKQDNV